MISVIKEEEVLRGNSIRAPSQLSLWVVAGIRTSQSAEYPTVQAFCWNNYDSWKNKTNSINNIIIKLQKVKH